MTNEMRSRDKRVQYAVERFANRDMGSIICMGAIRSCKRNQRDLSV